MVWYMSILDSTIVAKVSNVLYTLVPRKRPSFQALFEGATVCGGRVKLIQCLTLNRF